jgi:two-component system copper resistance phosphate regulon response regulator CusR
LRATSSSIGATTSRTLRSRIDLTGKEFSLLEYLPLNAGRRVTRFMMMMMMMIEHIWNLTFDSPTNVVAVLCQLSAPQNQPQPLPEADSHCAGSGYELRGPS